MINRFLKFSQDKFEYLYNNSIIMKSIDKIILFSILMVFVVSVFAQSNLIGMFATITIFLTAVKLLVKPNETIEYNKTDLWLLVYFMIVIITLFGSSLFAQSFHGFLKYVIYLGFYVSLVQYLKNNKDKIWWIILTITCCASYEALQGFLQSIIRPEEISTWQDTSYLNPEQIISRVYGTLKPLNPNLYGGYMIAAIPALMASLAHETYYKRYINTGLLSILLLLSIYAVFASGCRGAYIALFAIFVTLIILGYGFFKENYKNLYKSVVAGLLVLGTTFIFSVSALRARVLSIFMMRTDSSNSFRFNVYNSCIEMFKDNWLLGIGLGNQNFREVYGLYMKTGFDALSAYNIYLETAVESGIFALISFVAFLVLILVKGWEYIKNSDDTKNIIFASCCFVSIIGLMTHGMVDTVFFRPQIHVIFWTMAAIIRVL